MAMFSEETMTTVGCQNWPGLFSSTKTHCHLKITREQAEGPSPPHCVVEAGAMSDPHALSLPSLDAGAVACFCRLHPVLAT